MPDYGHIVQAVVDSPWAILPAKLHAIRSLLELKASGVTLSDEDIRARLGGDPPPPRQASVSGAVAVLPVFGVLAQRMGMLTSMSGGTSTEALASDVRAAAADPQVKTILLLVDSPGGSTHGVTELASTLREVRTRKRIVSMIDATAGSAAYWLASQASDVILTPSGEAGSIGVFAAHQDISGALEKAGVTMTLIAAGPHKTEGSPFTALTPEAKAAIQRRVDAAYGRFVSDVAKGRVVSVETVKREFGGGRMLSADDALSAGLVDRVAPFGQVLAELQAGTAAPRGVTATAALRAEVTRAFGTPTPVDRRWRDRAHVALLDL
jgi:signal peptide peptidase SppA